MNIGNTVLIKSVSFLNVNLNVQYRFVFPVNTFTVQSIRILVCTFAVTNVDFSMKNKGQKNSYERKKIFF